MKNRIERQARAFEKALVYCRIFGLFWKEHIIPKRNGREITGYYVTDETQSTTVATINL